MSPTLKAKAGLGVWIQSRLLRRFQDNPDSCPGFRNGGGATQGIQISLKMILSYFR